MDEFDSLYCELVETHYTTYIFYISHPNIPTHISQHPGKKKMSESYLYPSGGGGRARSGYLIFNNNLIIYKNIFNNKNKILNLLL